MFLLSNSFVIYTKDNIVDKIASLALYQYLKEKKDTTCVIQYEKFLGSINIIDNVSQVIILGFTYDKDKFIRGLDEVDHVTWISPYTSDKVSYDKMINNLSKSVTLITTPNDIGVTDSIFLVEQAILKSPVKVTIYGDDSSSDYPTLVKKRINESDISEANDSIDYYTKLIHSNNVKSIHSSDDKYAFEVSGFDIGKLTPNSWDILIVKKDNYKYAFINAPYEINLAHVMVGNTVDAIIQLNMGTGKNSIAIFNTYNTLAEDTKPLENYLEEIGFSNPKSSGNSGYMVMPLSWRNIILKEDM